MKEQLERAGHCLQRFAITFVHAQVSIEVEIDRFRRTVPPISCTTSNNLVRGQA